MSKKNHNVDMEIGDIQHIDTIKNSTQNQDSQVLPKNEIFTVPHRFNILFMLYLYGEMNFTILRKRLNLTPGNLKHHIVKLKEFGWIEENVAFEPRVLQMVDITAAGRKKFEKYTSRLKNLLDQI